MTQNAAGVDPVKVEKALQECPPVDWALVQFLNQRFPLRPPKKGATTEDIWRYCGERAVVDFLLNCFARQNKVVIKHVLAQSQDSGSTASRGAARAGGPADRFLAG